MCSDLIAIYIFVAETLRVWNMTVENWDRLWNTQKRIATSGGSRIFKVGRLADWTAEDKRSHIASAHGRRAGGYYHPPVRVRLGPSPPLPLNPPPIASIHAETTNDECTFMQCRGLLAASIRTKTTVTNTLELALWRNLSPFYILY